MTKSAQLYDAVVAERAKNPKAKIADVAAKLGMGVGLFYQEKKRRENGGKLLDLEAGVATAGSIPHAVKRVRKPVQRLEAKRAAAVRETKAPPMTVAHAAARHDLRVLIVSGGSDQLRDFVRSVI